jgi:8-oxo-dGTP pyrophosphatase MutT (NUDIX family)
VTPHLDGDPASDGRDGLEPYEYPGGYLATPAWWSLAPARRRLSVSQLSSRLLASSDSPVPREFEATQQVRPAAAIIPIVNHLGEAALVVTKRPATMKFHGNDWVFPGGVIDAGRDRDGQQAALRELHEELGVPPDCVTVLGHLSSYGPFVTGFGLQVYVGRLAEGTPILPDDNEVADVTILPVSRLSEPGNYFLSGDMPEGYDPGPTATPNAVDWHSPRLLLRHFVVTPGEFLWGTQGDIVYDFLQRVFTPDVSEHDLA